MMVEWMTHNLTAFSSVLLDKWLSAESVDTDQRTRPDFISFSSFLPDLKEILFEL